MNRIKNNKWNRIFHRNTIKSCQEKVNIYLTRCLEGQNFIEAIDKAETLGQLLNIHKDAWGSGFQCNNLATCPWGIFRTKSIENMIPGEVYLGSISGLYTHAIPYWEEHKEEKYNDFKTVYDVVLTQYKQLLRSNINYLFAVAKSELPVYKRLGYEV